ncbi:hypothetical protein BDQ12DRAFT_723952 [Crucibulum laeve]|uniref:Uncharacterized protein n=1 Tax=Crucibulum laeve TaxID=68775 RepID=A0A5C3LYF9_9AGAR|nr:hypothetical protein BDQ12DRAFT_723952 [Crucibulum laeve]
MTDTQVWDMSDDEIIEASKSIWRSPVYDHYDISLIHEGLSAAWIIKFAFNYQARLNTSEGTSNLQATAQQCNELHGTQQILKSASSKPTPPTIPYSDAAHFLDEDYRSEVEMLHPGTTLPHLTTISTDINHLYVKLSDYVCNYFMGLNSAIHLVLDGWTAPIIASYLGIVIVWYTNGQIHRCVLEFIKLCQKHDGQYLATMVANCLSHFGLKDLSKKSVVVAHGAHHNTQQQRGGANVHVEEEIIVEEGSEEMDIDADEAVQLETEATEASEAEEGNDGRLIHD